MLDTLPPENTLTDAQERLGQLTQTVSQIEDAYTDRELRRLRWLSRALAVLDLGLLLAKLGITRQIVQLEKAKRQSAPQDESTARETRA